MSRIVSLLKLLYSQLLKIPLFGSLARFIVRKIKQLPSMLKPVYSRILLIPVLGPIARRAVGVTKPLATRIYGALFLSGGPTSQLVDGARPLHDWERIEMLENQVTELDSLVRMLTDIIDQQMSGETAQARRLEDRLDAQDTMIRRLDNSPSDLAEQSL